MRELRTNTGTRITVGPFYDVTTGITPELSLTAGDNHLTLIVDTAGVPTVVLDTTPTGANVMAHITGDDAGLYDLTLEADNVNYLGRAFLSIVDDSEHLPVFHEFEIVAANWYDTKYGTDYLETEVISTSQAAIVDAVWDEDQADHVGAGTFGITASEIATIDSIADAILALLDNARGEPGTGAPPVNPDAMTKLDYLYKFMRNKIETVTSTGRIHVYDDAGSIKHHSSAISDDGNIFTRGEFGAGD